VTHEATFLQRLNEDEAVIMEPSLVEKVSEETDILQYSLDRLIADFVTGIRRDDKAHTTVPNLPSLNDGLKVQKIFSAVRLSDKERRWVALNELA
jgi:predicted dehydrogenase